MRLSIFARHVLPLALAGSLGALSVGTTSAVGLAGCNGRAASASERLRDAVVGYNDELRFGRNDLAVQRVSGGYRTAFIGSHYRWSREIQIADIEVVNVEAAGADGERATSFVSVRWFVRTNMIVQETLVRQEWEKHGGQYVLQTERVIDGDPALLTVPEGFRPESTGLEGNDVDAGVPDAAADTAAPATTPMP